MMSKIHRSLEKFLILEIIFVFLEFFHDIWLIFVEIYKIQWYNE